MAQPNAENNIGHTTCNVKPEIPKGKHGPYTYLSTAIAAGKADRKCQQIGTLTVLKVPGGFDYVAGASPKLFSHDKIISQYFFLNNRVWSSPQGVAR